MLEENNSEDSDVFLKKEKQENSSCSNINLKDFSINLINSENEEYFSDKIEEIYPDKFNEFSFEYLDIFLKNEKEENSSCSNINLIDTSINLINSENEEYFSDKIEEIPNKFEEFLKKSKQFFFTKAISGDLKKKENIIKKAVFLKNYGNDFLTIFNIFINRLKILYISCKCDSCKTCEEIDCKNNIKIKKDFLKLKKYPKNLSNLEKCEKCKKCITEELSIHEQEIKSSNCIRTIFNEIIKNLKDQINPQKELLKKIMEIKFVKKNTKLNFIFLNKYFGFNLEEVIFTPACEKFLFEEKIKKFKNYLKENFSENLKKILENAEIIKKKFSKVILILEGLFEKNFKFEKILKINNFISNKIEKKVLEKRFNLFIKDFEKMTKFLIKKKIIIKLADPNSNICKKISKKKKKINFFQNLQIYLNLSRNDLLLYFKDDFRVKIQKIYLKNNISYFLAFKKALGDIIYTYEKKFLQKIHLYSKDEFAKNFAEEMVHFFRFNKMIDFLKSVEKEKEFGEFLEIK